MPSVYLEADGRLRCQAARGYWQIFDGMLPMAGVIGRTFATGAEHVGPDTAADRARLAAGDRVRAQACLPLRVRGVVVGVLVVESPEPLSPRDLGEVREGAAELSRFLADHRPAPPNPAQRLARKAAALAQLTSTDDIVAEAVDAACAVSGLSSAVVVLSDAQAEWHVCATHGPFAGVFCDLRPDELARIATWVEHGTSSYTVSEPTGSGFAGHQALRASGVGTLLVLPLEASGRRLGFLALADGADRRLATEDAELMELLATQVAAGLRVAGAVADLRRRARTDPLTGLGHHGGFHAALDAALEDGGRVALVLVDLDGFKGLNDTLGHRMGDAVLRSAADLLRGALPPEAEAFRIGGDEFALLFADGGEGAACHAAEAVRRDARAMIGLTVSAGVAGAAAGERGGDIVERADAALYAVKRDGRDGVRVASRAAAAPAWQASLF
jgi:diguanylate cyclase (GGDEF)-like protein